MTKAKICRTASSVLAAAMYETFPGVSLLGGSETSYGFFYDFIFPHVVHPELHHQIEEKMRQIVREKRAIRSMEMVGASAREFLKSKKHKVRSSQVQGSGLFSLIEMGDFVDLSLGDLLGNSSEVPHFKIFAPESIGEGSWRISGTAHHSKEELKKFLKVFSEYAKTRHEVVGDVRLWWRGTEDGLLWMPQGILARDRFVGQCKECLCAGGVEVSCPRGSTLFKAWEVLPHAESIFEVSPVSFAPNEDVGLFFPEEALLLRWLNSFKNRISCLQSIEKMLNILGFNYRICLTRSARDRKAENYLEESLTELGWAFQEGQEKVECPRLDFLVRDGLGREWSAVSVQARKCLDVQVIVERNLALLLEI